jgi:hypothetical protein
MSWFEIIADRKIRDAQDEGTFENLPGKGKPLHLETDLRVPPELRAAYRLMKEARILPDWIQLDKEIRQRQAQYQVRLEAFAAGREEDLASVKGRDREAVLDGKRDRFVTLALEDLRAQNRMIERLNLMVPTPAQQRLRVNLRERLEELEARLPRFRPPDPGTAGQWSRLVEEERPPTQLANRMPLRRKQGSIG